MKTLIIAVAWLFFPYLIFTQEIPSDRIVDWSTVGVIDASIEDFKTINVADHGLIGDSLFINNHAFKTLFDQHPNEKLILQFGSGTFLFNQTLNIPSHTIIKGLGAHQTQLVFDQQGQGHSIVVQGQINTADTASLITDGEKGHHFITVSDPTHFQPNDWIQIIQNDDDFVTSHWALGTVGQILQIEDISVENQQVSLKSALRFNYPLTRQPYIVKINPIQKVGIECLKIKRIDNTAPQQASNLLFEYAVNAWVSGIESEQCNYAHVDLRSSSNLTVSNSYFHHGLEYGGGGRAYGALLHFTTNEVQITNNVFEHLRHSILLQAGANGNVLSYNYSTRPYWDAPPFPSDAAGELVLHGNYPYANLFEQNIIQNIVIDNSHGANGPYNTFFRNRATGFGIFFSDAESPGQNIVSNEITNTTFPYNFVNYTILGEDHFILGNWNKDEIDHPIASENLRYSYYLNTVPDFLPANSHHIIGHPDYDFTTLIPALDRFDRQGNISLCDEVQTSVQPSNPAPLPIYIYPNPFRYQFTLSNRAEIQKIELYNIQGQLMEEIPLNKSSISIHQPSGLYYLRIYQKNHWQTLAIIKQ